MKRENRKPNKQIGYAALLFAAALIWGFAFVAQSKGAESLDAFSFLTFRCWIAAICLFPIFVFRIKRVEHFDFSRFLTASLICGVFLFFAAASQQYGIAYTSTGKAGFITALYVVFVPVILLFKKNIPSKLIVICLILSVLGLYLLCIDPHDFSNINKGDAFELICAFLFSLQIISVNYYVHFVDPILLSIGQLFVEALFSTLFMLLFGTVQVNMITAALPALLYTGILSSAIGFTLQIIAQSKINPTVASLIMCLESVFSAIGGWMILGQTLTTKEIIGCCIMFAAIVLSQFDKKHERIDQEH